MEIVGVFGGALLLDIKDLVFRANASVLLDVCARCSRGADDVQAPIAHVAGKNFVAAGYRFELVVFGPDGNTGVLLDERARGTRASRDIPAEIRRGTYEVIPAAYGGGCQGELLRIACRTGGLDKSGEGRGATGVNAEIAVCVLDRHGAGRRRRRTRIHRQCGFFFNDTATTEIYPLSLHDALPI